MEKKFFYTNQKSFVQDPKVAWDYHNIQKFQPNEAERRDRNSNSVVSPANPNEHIHPTTSHKRLDLAQNYKKLVSSIEQHLPKGATVSGVRLAAGASSRVAKYIEHLRPQEDLHLKNSEGRVGFVQLFRQRMHYEELGIPLNTLELIYMGDDERKRRTLVKGRDNSTQTECSMNPAHHRMPPGWAEYQAAIKKERNRTELCNPPNPPCVDCGPSMCNAEGHNVDIDVNNNNELARQLPELHELSNIKKFTMHENQPHELSTEHSEPANQEVTKRVESGGNPQDDDKLYAFFPMGSQSLLETVESILQELHDNSEDESSSSDFNLFISFNLPYNPTPPPPPPPELKPSSPVPDKARRSPSPFPLCEHEDTKSCTLCEIWVPREADSKEKPLKLLPKIDEHEGGKKEGEQCTEPFNSFKNEQSGLYHELDDFPSCSIQAQATAHRLNQAELQESLEQQAEQQAARDPNAKTKPNSSTATLDQVWNKTEHSKLISDSNYLSTDLRYVGNWGSPILSELDADHALYRVAILCEEYDKLKQKNRMELVAQRFRQLRQFQDESIRDYFHPNHFSEQPKTPRPGPSDSCYYACPMRRSECMHVQNRYLLAHFLTTHLSQKGLALSELQDGGELLISFQPRTFRRSHNVCLSIIVFAGPVDNPQSVCNAGLPSKYMKFVGHVPLLVMACRTRLPTGESERLYAESQSTASSDANSNTGDTSYYGPESQELTENVMALWLVSMELIEPIYVYMTVFNRRLDIIRTSIVEVRSIRRTQNIQKFIGKSKQFLKLTGQDLRLLTNNYSEPIYLEIIVRQNQFPLPVD